MAASAAIGSGGTWLLHPGPPRRSGPFAVPNVKPARVKPSPLHTPGVRWHHKVPHRVSRNIDGRQRCATLCRSVVVFGACAVLFLGVLCQTLAAADSALGRFVVHMANPDEAIWLAVFLSSLGSASSWDMCAWVCLAVAAPDYWQKVWIVSWAAISRLGPWCRAAACLYAAHFFCVFFELHHTWSKHRLPKRWASSSPHVSATVLAVADSRYQNEVRTFHRGSTDWQHHYMFKLRILNVYALSNEGLVQQHAEALAAMGADNGGVRMLYHGTSEANARMIAALGFKLPDKQGMFGRGIYFADTPLKSWQYARGKNWNKFSARGRSVGYLLVCAVALGRPKEMRQASNSLDPKKGDLMPKAPDLSLQVRISLGLTGAWALIPAYRALMPRVLRAYGVPDFDSVEAVPRSSGGAVIVPEFVIYHPERALPLYLLEVEQNNH